MAAARDGTWREDGLGFRSYASGFCKQLETVSHGVQGRAVSVVNVLVTTAWESCYVCLRMCSQLLQVGELTELQNAGLYVGLLI